jgi:tight adherence protein B
MGALIGLLFGLGLLLIWQSRSPRRVNQRRRRKGSGRIAELLAQAGVDGVTPAALVGTSVGVGVVAGVLALLASRTWTIALAFAVIASYAPTGLVRFRRRRRRNELRDVWPEVVDNLASAVRAGLALPEAVAQIGVRGPVPLRAAFQRFGEDYRATGRFNDCLDRLKETLADPVADRIVESLRMAREVGGNDLGRLLRTLSAFLREDVRTRAEIEARQSWTVNAARLAVAAPWILLGVLAMRPEAVRAYDSSAGLVVLTCGAGVCLVAYRLMLRLGRLAEEERVLR